jgi:hypothetical protein
MQLSRRVLPVLCAAGILPLLVSCGILAHQRVLHDEHGIRIGLEGDPTLKRSDPSSMNAHPANLSAEELRALLERLRVSGWSGTITGLVVTPSPIPVFREQELRIIVPPIVRALREAQPSERVFFSIPDLAKPYHPERTEGALFLRGRYLYVTLTEHSAYTRTDTGGGEEKDPRDTKGMVLSVAPPFQPASPGPSEEPHWGPFGKVHIALDVKQSLAALSTPPLAQSPAVASQEPEQNTPADLRLQLKELTFSNLELRKRLLEQAEEMRRLKEELARVRRMLEGRTTDPPPPVPAP